MTNIEAWAKRARMYDNKHIMWGKVDISIPSMNEQLSYRFIVDKVVQDFR